MLIRKRRIFFIATFLIIAAVAVVLCVTYFTRNPVTEYDGTLVSAGITYQCI